MDPTHHQLRHSAFVDLWEAEALPGDFPKPSRMWGKVGDRLANHFRKKNVFCDFSMIFMSFRIFSTFHHFFDGLDPPMPRPLMVFRAPRHTQETSRSRGACGGRSGIDRRTIFDKKYFFEFSMIFMIFRIFRPPGILRWPLTLTFSINMYVVPRPDGRPAGSPAPTDGCFSQ